jgi:Uma2 family endonuclease
MISKRKKAPRTRATIEDLYRVTEDGKAELIDGEIVLMSPTGDAPNYAAGEIFASLREYARRLKFGRAVTDNAGFRVNLPHRESISPDAGYYVGPPKGMEFFPVPPVFAAEVRSQYGYGPDAERRIAEKRADYFAAGTKVVWDVDLLSADVVRAYRADDTENPTIYRRGDIAEATPAVPGWSMPVDDLFQPEPEPDAG